MHLARRALGSIVLAAALVLAGCSGGATGSPVDTVKQALGLIEAGQYAKVADLSCAASKDKAAQQFDFAGAIAGNLPQGMDAQQVQAAIHVTTSGLVVTEESRTDAAAVVRIKGTASIAVDPDKFKVVLKSYLQNLGQPADDATIAAVLGQTSSLLSSDQPVDTTAALVLENGAWKICG